MKLRKLKLNDTNLMLEWMHDFSVVENLNANFMGKTIKDCQKFIENAQNVQGEIHLAIADDFDIYMGTVSLKHIRDHVAEFAIVIRKAAMGKGYSKYGMSEIIRIGFEELNLNKIYWCVSKENERAIRFYNKNGYNLEKVTLRSKLRNTYGIKAKRISVFVKRAR